MAYPIIDISDWQYTDKNVSGSKEKRWYISNEDKKLALFKLPISFTSNTQTIFNEVSGEAWSEKISSEIGRCIGFKVHEVDLAKLTITPETIEYYGINTETMKYYSDIPGSLCWSFLNENESLIEGADMIMEYDHTYERDKLRGNIEIYNFDLLYRIFRDYGILEELFKMIIFDTIIGNTDRHQDNFGVIRNESTGNIRGFAPFYDNASSLARELNTAKAKQMLTDDRMFHAYLFGNKSSTLIRFCSEWGCKKINIFTFYDLVKERYPDQIKKYTQYIEVLSNRKINGIINNIPNEIMSDIHKELVVKLLIKRRNYLLNKENKK